MADLKTKLNLKEAGSLLLLSVPALLEPMFAELAGVALMRRLPRTKRVQAALIFVQKQAELDTIARAVTARAEGDATLWFAYPKKSSKNYSCEFNRDTGWAVLGAAGYEPVRQVAIDEDWSALRFRKVEFIKSFTHATTMALSAAGKQRAS